MEMLPIEFSFFFSGRCLIKSEHRPLEKNALSIPFKIPKAKFVLRETPRTRGGDIPKNH